MHAVGSRLAIVAILATLAACARPVDVSLPTGDGAPLADPGGLVSAVAESCAGVDTVIAEARISGTVGGGRVRATLLVVADRSGNARVEALAGPGGAVLVLTAQGEEATLVLPRDNQVLEGASIAEILEALVGVRMAAGDLARTLVGCYGLDGAPVAGRRYGGAVEAFDLPNGTTVWTKTTPDGRRTIGGRRGSLTVTYRHEGTTGPSGVRLVVRQGGAASRPEADLTLSLSRVEVNEPIDPVAFVARVPRDAEVIALDTLRRSGPLGGGPRR